MRGFEWRTIVAATIVGSGLFLAAGAQAHDDDRWRWEHRHHHGHHGPERHVLVERQPVYVAPAPVIVAPMAPVYAQPVYSQPADPSLNFNFTIPLR